MRFTAAAAATMVGAATASWAPEAGSHGPPHGSYGPPASNGTWDSYTTEVVTAFTTYCPVATEVTHGGQTYTATKATTLTITNCEDGCTVTKPLSTSAPAETSPVETSVEVETTPSVEVHPTAPTSEVVVVPTTPATVAPVYPTANGTVPAPAPSGTGASTPTESGEAAPIQTDNAATRFSVGAAGILAVFGVVFAL